MRKKYYLIFLFFNIVFGGDNFFQKGIASIIKNVFPRISVQDAQGALVVSAIRHCQFLLEFFIFLQEIHMKNSY